MSHPSANPLVQAFQLSTGFAQTQAVVTFVRLGVADYLRDDTKSVEDIAGHCSAHPEMLYRFLRFLAKTGVVELDDRQCRLTPVGQFFRRDMPGGLTKALEITMFEPWQKAWQQLEYAVRTGEAAFPHANGQTAWEYLEQHPDMSNVFNAYMTSISQMSAQALVSSYDFSPFDSICDVGGGQGFLLKTILGRNPDIKGILFDLPQVVKNVDPGELAPRLGIAGGSFFEKIPSADLLILKSVLHDWNDEKAISILQHCAEALPAGGKVLAMDMVIMEGGNPISLFYDMHMQVLMGGRERTQEEFVRLFAKAGLRVTRFIPTPSPQFIMEAEKA